MQASQVTGEVHLPLSFHVHESCLVAGARLGATSMGCSAVAFADEEPDMLMLMLLLVFVSGVYANARVLWTDARPPPSSMYVSRDKRHSTIRWRAFDLLDRLGTDLTKWENLINFKLMINQNAVFARVMVAVMDTKETWQKTDSRRWKT